MDAFIFILRISSINLIALTAVQILLNSPNRRFNLYYGALAVCMVVYLFTPYFFHWPGAAFNWSLPFFAGLTADAVASATPAVFAMFTLIIFREKSPSIFMVISIFAMMLLDMIGFSCEQGRCSPLNGLSGQVWSGFMVDQFPHLLRLGFMAASVVWTLEGWSADLVESRRRFRVVFLIVQGLLIFTVVILENFIPLTLLSEELCLLMSSLMIFVAAMLLAVFFLQAKPELSQQITVSVETSSNSREKNTTQIPKPNSVNDDSINRVKTFLNNGTWYKQTDLTIGHLASQLSMPEYKLRQLVNKQMGYRNFNVLLNKYRIGAACEMLKDEQFNNLPILNIALEVGFRSLSTFNKAFKELLETTPSEYRKSKSL